MRTKPRFLVGILLITALFLVACRAESETRSAEREPGMGPGMGRDGGMMGRHMATVPDEYAGMSNPQEASEASLARGEEIYDTYCETCHGAGGMGDGPAGENLDPPPAPIARTSRMLGDDYLFWRISEGGSMEPFNSAMPAWKKTLDEGERWDVINYIRSLE